MDSLSDVLQKMERYEDSAAMYEKILEIDPDNPTAAHFAAALQGKNTEAPPSGYIRDLFDDFAVNFEEALTKKLAYDVPNLMRETLAQLRADGNIISPFKCALDLGCGTGLGGKALRELVGELHGVDISAKMVAEAKAKRVYDSLDIAENVEYLAQSGTGKVFDLIYAADVFVYVGSLEATFAAVHSRLVSSGIFTFSVESLDHGTYVLHRTGRYAHHVDYIKALASKFGFIVQECQDIVVRQDRGHPIVGLLLVLIKN